MTKEEIRKFLDNTKVYVNGKSREIQEKLFTFGYGWCCGDYTEVHKTDKPFLLISKNRDITYVCSMHFFIEHEYREITAEEILSIEITEEPSYRPFNAKDELWKEMRNHKPFGWVKYLDNDSLCQITELCNIVEVGGTIRAIDEMFEDYTFADGTPFGIKE